MYERLELVGKDESLKKSGSRGLSAGLSGNEKKLLLGKRLASYTREC